MEKKAAKILFAGLALTINLTAAAGVIAPLDAPTVTTVAPSLCTMVSASSSFDFRASRNVGLGYTCDATTVAVNAGNIKGKFAYGGSSLGGSVKQCTSLVSATNGYSVAGPALTADGCS